MPTKDYAIRSYNIGDAIRFKLNEIGGIFDGFDGSGKIVKKITSEFYEVMLDDGLKLLISLEEIIGFED